MQGILKLVGEDFKMGGGSSSYFSYVKELDCLPFGAMNQKEKKKKPLVFSYFEDNGFIIFNLVGG